MGEDHKTRLHLELNAEKNQIQCELPNNFIVALAAIRHATDEIAARNFRCLTARDNVIVHLEFDVLGSNESHSLQITGSEITAKGMLDYAREMVMVKLVRPSLETRIVTATTIDLGNSN